MLSIIEGKYIEKEKSDLIDFHIAVMKIGLMNEGEKKWNDSYEPQIKEVSTKYYNDTFKESVLDEKHMKTENPLKTENPYNLTERIVDAWSLFKQSRYFVDIRGGCGAVRDKWHESYDEDYPGLHRDTPDVVEYRHGYIGNGIWNMGYEDIKYLNELCERLNNEV